jgi:hypothetical protein
VALLLGKVKAVSMLLGRPGQLLLMGRGYPASTASYSRQLSLQCWD